LNRAGIEAYLRFLNCTEVVDGLPRNEQPNVGCFMVSEDIRKLNNLMRQVTSVFRV
jgi:hypothetical protein